MTRTGLGGRMTQAAGAFLLLGAWAAFSSRAEGLRPMLFAFISQGLLSVILVLALRAWLDQAWGSLFAEAPSPWRRLTPPLIGSLIIGLALVSAHALAGTPNLAAAVFVPWSIFSIYAFVYTAKL